MTPSLSSPLPQGVGDRKGDSSTWESETEGLNADGDEDLNARAQASVASYGTRSLGGRPGA